MCLVPALPWRHVLALAAGFRQAIACFRLFTILPLRPLSSGPSCEETTWLAMTIVGIILAVVGVRFV
jgi:hypothetical protein